MKVSVRVNQILIDKPYRGFRELELLEKGITIPNSIVDTDNLLGGNADCTNIQ